MTLTSTVFYEHKEKYNGEDDNINDNFDNDIERNVTFGPLGNAILQRHPTTPQIGGESDSTNLFSANFLEPLRQRKLMSSSGILLTLHMLRDPIVEYQSSRGVPRNEHITFMSLITSLITQAYTAALTILVMLYNLLPLVEGLIYFVRFVLDKMIDILETTDPKDKAMKSVIFCGELFVILIIIFLIVGLIFMPVYVLTAKLFGKLWGMVVW